MPSAAAFVDRHPGEVGILGLTLLALALGLVVGAACWAWLGWAYGVAFGGAGLLGGVGGGAIVASAAAEPQAPPGEWTPEQIAAAMREYAQARTVAGSGRRG